MSSILQLIITWTEGSLFCTETVYRSGNGGQDFAVGWPSLSAFPNGNRRSGLVRFVNMIHKKDFAALWQFSESVGLNFGLISYLVINKSLEAQSSQTRNLHCYFYIAIGSFCCIKFGEQKRCLFPNLMYLLLAAICGLSKWLNQNVYNNYNFDFKTNCWWYRVRPTLTRVSLTLSPCRYSHIPMRSFTR